MKVVFTDWQNKVMIDIGKDMIAKRRSRIGIECGEAYATGL